MQFPNTPTLASDNFCTNATSTNVSPLLPKNIDEIKTLSMSLDLVFLHQTCMGKLSTINYKCIDLFNLFYLFIYLVSYIDTEALRNIQVHHVKSLLSSYPLGVLIKFEINLELWQTIANSSESSSTDDSSCQSKYLKLNDSCRSLMVSAIGNHVIEEKLPTSITLAEVTQL